MGLVVEHILARLTEGGVRHLDETGLRVAGKLHWLHAICDTAFTHYRIDAKRGAVPTFLTGGTIVHDHWKSYYAHMNGVDAHALCGAHHLRELKAIEDIEKEPWATEMSALLNRANQLRCTAQDQGETELPEPVRQDIITGYMAILAEGLAFHERQPPLAKSSGARGGVRQGSCRLHSISRCAFGWPGHGVAAASFMGERVGVPMAFPPSIRAFGVQPNRSDGVPVARSA